MIKKQQGELAGDTTTPEDENAHIYAGVSPSGPGGARRHSKLVTRDYKHDKLT